jgi:hypothetical protein
MIKGLFYSMLGCLVASAVMLSVSYTAWHSDIDDETANLIGYNGMIGVLLIAAAIYQFHIWKLYRGSRKYLTIVGLNLAGSAFQVGTYLFAVYVLLNFVDPGHLDFLFDRDVTNSAEELDYFKHHYYELSAIFGYVLSFPIQLTCSIIILLVSSRTTSNVQILDA